jgi:membrane-associated phospholipid phosphatase
MQGATGKTASAAGAGLLLRSAAALFLTGIVVALCYAFVDRPVAWFVHDHHLARLPWLHWPVAAGDWLKLLMPWMLVLAVLWRTWKPAGRLQAVCLAVSTNLVVTAVLKESLKRGFGRYWPETWTRNNPSLIADGAYGFHPFQHGPAYESFPSGHAAMIFSAMSILWIVYPRGRLLYALVCLYLCVGLVGMNYHFVGDVIAGAALGSITGVFAVHLFRLSALDRVGWVERSEPHH